MELTSVFTVLLLTVEQLSKWCLFIVQLAEEPQEINIMLLSQIIMRQKGSKICGVFHLCFAFPISLASGAPPSESFLRKGFDINQFCQNNQLYRFQVICFLSQENVY